MKIVALKDNLYNTKDFMKKVAEQPYLDGISFNVTTTKDNEIIIFNAISTNEILLENIQRDTLENIKKSTIATFEQTLKESLPYTGKIIINILPLTTPELNDDNIETINRITYEYVERILEIANRYPTLKLYLTSASHRIIYYLEQMEHKAQIGVTLSNDNLNYIDVDFYIFNPYMFDFAIMNEQLNKGKEIMVIISTLDELSIIIGHFRNSSPLNIKTKIYHNIIAITPHTEILCRIQKSDQNKKGKE